MNQNKTQLAILLFANPVEGDVYSIAFESLYGIKTIVCSTPEDAMRELCVHPEACLLADPAGAGPKLGELFLTQSRFARRALLVIIGLDPAQAPPEAEGAHAKFLSSGVQLSEVTEQVEKGLALRAAGQQFCRLSIKTLLTRNARLRCAVYIKLSEEKYVKVLQADDKFEEVEYERFRAKGVEHLYLLREDFLSVMNDLLKKAQALVGGADTSDEAALQTSSAIFDLVHNAFPVEGFTPELRRLAEASIELAMDSAKRKGRLNELLTHLDSSRTTYLNWHTTALSFLTCKMATLLGWESDSTFYKLSLASILHDLPLSADELSILQTTAELAESNLTETEKVRVLRHPIDAATLAASFEDATADVGFILEQHHERPDGSGFPRKLEHRDVSPISALFIVAHDIVHTMFKAPPQNFDIHRFLEERESEKAYARGNYQQVFRALLTKKDEF